MWSPQRQTDNTFQHVWQGPTEGRLGDPGRFLRGFNITGIPGLTLTLNAYIERPPNPPFHLSF